MNPDGTEDARAREKRAVELAEARGRRQQIVDGRLDGHDQHFARINGSLDRVGTRMEDLEKEVAGLRGEVGTLRGEIGTLAAVVKQAAKNALDNRTFLVASAVLAVMIIGLFVSGGHS